MNKQRKTSHILNVFQYDDATGIIGLNGAPVSGYGLYLTTNINDGSVGIDSSANINALYLLKNSTKQFEISYDTSGATKLFRLLPYQSGSFFQIGNPSNAANSNSDYVFISESVYGNVLIGPGIGNATGNLTGATASIHKVQFNGAVFANNSIQATSFKITGGASTGFLKADGTVDAVTYLSGNQSIIVSGDATGSGTTSITLTLANTAVTPGSYGSTTLVPVVTVDSKGRITSVTTAAISGSLTFTGDVTGSGTTGTSTAMTLAASGVTAGTYTKVTVDSKGRVTVGASATTTDIAEGTRLYYTDARVLSYLSANTYATQSYVNTQVSNLVAAAPATLDTLNELAAALGNDASFSTTISTALGNRLRVDINTQGLSATLQGYGRTNLGLGTAAVSNTGDFVAYRTFGTAANSATGDFVAYRTFGTAANNNTGDFAAASHTHSIANVTGLQTALDGKQASGSYAASSHSHIISDVTGLQTALDGKQASLGFTPYNATNPSGYITSSASISGNASTATLAANSTLWNGAAYNGAAYAATTDRLLAYDLTNSQWRPVTASQVQTLLGLGSLAYSSATIPTNNNQLTNGAGYITGVTNISGNAATASNASALGGYAQDFQTVVGTGDYLIIRNQAASKLSLASWASVQSGLGLGTMAYASTSSYVPYGNLGNTFGMNDQKLYLRTNGDNNHYIWNAADDWEEIVAYNGTGLRISTSTGTTLATFSASGNTMNIVGNATYATNSTRLYASDGVYVYGGAASYYMYMTYDGGSYWELKVSPATPGTVKVAYANSAGSASYATSETLATITARGASTSTSITAADFYTAGWFRNSTALNGLYNSAYDTHFYASGTGQWNFATSNNSWIQIALRPANHQSTVRGYLYADTNNNVGLLTNDGNWGLRVDVSKNAFIYGTDLTVGTSTSSNIYMTDTDETTRRIHCNSGRIGFLNSSASWGAWNDNTGNWRTDFSMYASSGYFYASGGIRLGDMWGGNGLYAASGAMVFGTESSNDWIFSNGAVTKAYISGGTGTLYAQGGITDTGFSRILTPKGGYYQTTASSVTGAIKITQPFLNGAQMSKMTVKIYEYSTGKSFTITVCGHRDGNSWYNVAAYQYGDTAANDITVRFGHDGTYNCIWIGEVGQVWSYPQVFITDIQNGYSSINSVWNGNWTISFVGAFNTVMASRVAKANASRDGTGASGTWGISITGNAATVGGYAPSGPIGANTVVIRDANNYIYAYYINSSVSETENPTINSFYTSNGDGWLRKSSVAHVKSQLGLGSNAYTSTSFFRDLGFEGGGSNANTIAETRSAFTYAAGAPHSGPLAYFGAGGYGLQLNATYHTGDQNISYRVRNGDAGTFKAWYSFITSANIASQSVSYASTAGSAPNASNSNSFYNVTPGTGNGIKFWDSDAYKISMGASGLYYYGPVTDYSIKTQMNDGDTGRGFTWGRTSYAPIAALNSTSGNMQIAGTMASAGGTMTGQLNMFEGSYTGTIRFGTVSYWSCGISQRDAANAEMRIWAKGGSSGSIYFATNYDGELAAATLPTDGMALKNNNLGIGGFTNTEFPVSKLHVKGRITVQNGDDSGTYYGPNSTWGAYLYVGAASNKIGSTIAQVISTNGNLHMDAGNGKFMYLNYYSNADIYMFGNLDMKGYSIYGANYVRSNTNIYTDQNYGYGLVGLYSSTVFQGIFAMGDAYKLTAGGGVNNLYGLAWSHPNAGGQAGYLDSHGLLVMVNGITYASISNSIWARGNITANGNMYSNVYYMAGSTSKYIQNNTTSYTSLYVGGNQNGYSGIRVDGGMNLMMHTNGVGGPVGFWHESAGWSILTYANGDQNLYSNGSLKLNTATYGILVTGEVRATGDITAYYSDIRLKKDIDVIPNAIEKIKKLRGVTYTWNDEEVNVVKKRSGQRDIGLIAQEVEAVEPLFTKEYQTPLDDGPENPDDAVNYNPRMSETYKTIKYDKLVALLVEGMKEQQLQIEELKNKLDNVLSSR